MTSSPNWRIELWHAKTGLNCRHSETAGRAGWWAYWGDLTSSYGVSVRTDPGTSSAGPNVQEGSRKPRTRACICEDNLLFVQFYNQCHTQRSLGFQQPSQAFFRYENDKVPKTHFCLTWLKFSQLKNCKIQDRRKHWVRSFIRGLGTFACRHECRRKLLRESIAEQERSGTLSDAI